MAKLFLESNDSFTVSDPAEVFGSTGNETIKVTGSANVTVDANVERLEFSGNLADYTFSLAGNVLTVTLGGATAGVFTLDGDTIKAAFADGSADLVLTGLGSATLGGTAVPTTDAAISTTLDASDPSTNAGSSSGSTTGQTFTLTSSADNLTLTAGNDTVTGSAGTLQATDVIIDTSTTDADEVEIQVNSFVSTQATMTNIETVNIQGNFASTGLDVANVIGTTTLNLSSGVSGSTGTVLGATTAKVDNIVADSNVSNLNVNTTAITSGTAGNVNIDGGTASTFTVGAVGATGDDEFTLKTSSSSTINLSGGSAGTDKFTLDLNGGTTSLNIVNNAAATGDIDILTINSNTADNNITLSSATHVVAGNGTGDSVVIGGSNAVTFTGDGDVFSGSSATNGIVLTKESGAGTVTFVNNAALGGASFFNEAAFDIFEVSNTATTQNITVNEATTLNLSVANGTQTYDVDNASSTTITAGAGSLNLGLTGSNTANATQASITTGAGVGTLIVANDTRDSVITTLDTSTTATTVDTVVINGSKNLTVSTWTATANELLTADAMTGNLTLTVGTNAATVIGGSGNDVITGGAAADNIRGGSGNDVLSGGTGASADTMVGGLGDDRFLIAVASTTDTISDFSISGTNGIDVIAFSAADNSVLTAPVDGNSVAIAAGATPKSVLVSSSKTLVAGENIVVLDGTFSSQATMESAIEAGGTHQLTLSSAPSASNDLIIVWSDGTDAHVGGYNLTTTATTPVAGDTFTEIATLSGIADVSSMSGANFLFLA